MKIAVSGKGGVGKTTLSAALANHYAAQGRRVIAIDADPDANLAIALGATPKQAAGCIPLSEMDDLIEERTGARKGSRSMFCLNPEVSDVADRCGLDINGVTFLRMGTVERGGAGCMCAESTFLKAFLSHVLRERDDTVILDMEAGVEHLGRGTAESVDVLVIVVEPGARSLQTALQIHSLASDIGIRRFAAVANKVRGHEDESYVRDQLGDIPLVAIVPESDAVRTADREGRSPYLADPAFDEAVHAVAAALDELGT